MNYRKTYNNEGMFGASKLNNLTFKLEQPKIVTIKKWFNNIGYIFKSLLLPIIFDENNIYLYFIVYQDMSIEVPSNNCNEKHI